MHLKHRFNNEDKIKYWIDHQFCGLCSSNQMCSLHHIETATSNDIYNSIMLCHICHKKADSFNIRGGTAGKEFRNKLKEYTKKWIEQVDSEYI